MAKGKSLSNVRRAACGTLLAMLVSVAAAQDAPFPPTDGDHDSAPSAQETGQPFRLSVTTRAVVLDVVVTDKKGNRVQRADLKAEDFTIYEDGKAQRMRSFESPTAHQMPASAKVVVNSAADLKKIGEAPVTVLVLDELNSRFEDMSYVRQMMVKYLEEQPAVLREPTVLMVAKNTTFQQLHDYTQDRDALIQIVKKHMPEFPWRLEQSGKSGPGAVERMAQVLAALQQVAQSSTGTRGRKNLVWVGNGFPSADLAGLDEQTADTIEAAIKRVTNRLLAARITMYSINPTPGSSASVDVESPDDLALALDANGGDPFGNGLASFSTLATATGGKAFQGRNDINNEIGEGISAGSFYYTMSYSPSNDSQDAAKYRNIKIVMKDPSMRATTRNGYYLETAAQANPVLDKTAKPKQVRANLELDISGALTSTISYNGLNVSAAKGGGGYSITVGDAELEWNTDAANVESAEATLAAGWYDAKGKLIGHVAREETSKRGASHSGAVFSLPVAPPPNAVRLRIVARDARSGRMGTVDLKP